MPACRRLGRGNPPAAEHGLTEVMGGEPSKRGGQVKRCEVPRLGRKETRFGPVGNRKAGDRR